MLRQRWARKRWASSPSFRAESLASRSMCRIASGARGLDRGSKVGEHAALAGPAMCVLRGCGGARGDERDQQSSAAFTKMRDTCCGTDSGGVVAWSASTWPRANAERGAWSPEISQLNESLGKRETPPGLPSQCEPGIGESCGRKYGASAGSTVVCGACQCLSAFSVLHVLFDHAAMHLDKELSLMSPGAASCSGGVQQLDAEGFGDNCRRPQTFSLSTTVSSVRWPDHRQTHACTDLPRAPQD